MKAAMKFLLALLIATQLGNFCYVFGAAPYVQKWALWYFGFGVISVFTYIAYRLIGDEQSKTK